MDDLELCYLPAVEALRSYRSKELSPLELLQALIRRTEAVEPRINAFTECYFEEALDQAARAEARYVAGNARPLEGLPIAIKDEPEIREKITTQGSLLVKDYVSDEMEINGKRVEPELSVAMCHQFNMISRRPVLSVPSGISANRVPAGVQLVGRTFDDESVFRAAAALEAARPPFCSASDRPVL